MLKELQYLLKGNPEINIGRVDAVSAKNKNGFIVKLSILPDEFDVIALATTALGIFTEPRIGDLFVVLIPEGDSTTAYCIVAIPGHKRELPDRVEQGGTVVGGIPEHKTHIVSDTKVNIGKGSETEEDEPLVLGEVLTTYLDKINTQLDQMLNQLISLCTACTAIDSAVGAGQIGPISGISSSLTSIKSTLTTEKNTYLDSDDTNIKSQIAFTERGD